MSYKLCKDCGCPIKPGRHKPNEYDHAQGCPSDRSKKARTKRKGRIGIIGVGMFDIVKLSNGKYRLTPINQ
jgi:hypothetical protein